MNLTWRNLLWYHKPQQNSLPNVYRMSALAELGLESTGMNWPENLLKVKGRLLVSTVWFLVMELVFCSSVDWGTWLQNLGLGVQILSASQQRGQLRSPEVCVAD